MTPRAAPFQPQPISGNIYLLEATGGNVALCAGSEGALLVDIPQAADVPRIIATLESFSLGPARYLVNTHWHDDHVAGNAALGTEMQIVAHENVRHHIGIERRFQTGVQAISPAKPSVAWPRTIFNDRLTLYLNGEEIQLHYLPGGHSDSDVLVWFIQANVVHLGDLFWPGVFPFVDVDYGGSVTKLLEHIDLLLTWLPETALLIPGHGPLSTRSALVEYDQMLHATTQWIGEQWEMGRTLAELQKAGLPEPWRQWGNGFISEAAWIELVVYDKER
jgi:cyclase